MWAESLCKYVQDIPHLLQVYYLSQISHSYPEETVGTLWLRANQLARSCRWIKEEEKILLKTNSSKQDHECHTVITTTEEGWQTWPESRVHTT